MRTFSYQEQNSADLRRIACVDDGVQDAGIPNKVAA
jgi:hypothetical protein